MRINRLPAITFNHLRMNDAEIEVNEAVYCPYEIKKDTTTGEALFEGEPQTGAGREADIVFEGLKALTFCGAPGKKEEAVVFFDAKEGDKKALVKIKACENSEITLVMSYRGEADTLAVRTLIEAEKGAVVKLVQLQLLGGETTLINDIGAVAKDEASVKLVQLFPGCNIYSGCRIDLVGEKSNFESDMTYMGQKKQHLDMNYVANHIGKETTSNIHADGILKDEASKLMRQTIDFKSGCSGSKGAEEEKVFLLGEDIINQSIPLILCTEEDVEGAHGAAIGRLDEEMLFYLASRGIDEAQAESLIINANFNRILRAVEDEEIKAEAGEYLKEVL